MTGGKGRGAARAAAFGALLRRHRLAASLTQEALAERAAVSATAIAALERGRQGLLGCPRCVRSLGADRLDPDGISGPHLHRARSGRTRRDFGCRVEFPARRRCARRPSSAGGGRWTTMSAASAGSSVGSRNPRPISGTPSLWKNASGRDLSWRGRRVSWPRCCRSPDPPRPTGGVQQGSRRRRRSAGRGQGTARQPEGSVDDLFDSELGTVLDGEPRPLFEGDGNGPVASHGRHAIVIHLEQLGRQGKAASVALALFGVDPKPHENTTGRMRGPRT